MPSIVPERIKKKKEKKITENEIIFSKPTKKPRKKSSLTAEQKLEKTRKKKRKSKIKEN